MKRVLMVFIVLIIVLLALVSCSDFIYGADDFYTGKQLSSEDLESIKTKVEETTAPYETNLDGEIIVYWTSGGAVYHFKRTCSSLSKSKTVESGSVEDALTAGKARPCSICSKETEEVK